jgi:hypothetical protein
MSRRLPTTYPAANSQHIGFGQVWAFELLDSLFGKGLHTGTEQRPRLLRGHWITGIGPVDLAISHPIHTRGFHRGR